MKKAKTWSVYGLIDPIDEQIYYIGMTANPKGRAYGHRTNLSQGTFEKARRLERMRAHGWEPVMVIFEDGLSRDDALDCEAHMISLGDRAGWPLTNRSRGWRAFANLTRSDIRKLAKRAAA